ncbi:MAG TPA: HAD family hydrolase [Smithella sp.]|nr:HAD family hydrolase [Smithella sp.]
MASLKIKETTIKTIIFDFDGTLAKLNIDFLQMREAVRELILSYGVNDLQTDYVLETIHGAAMILNRRSEEYAKKFAKEANAIIEKIEVEAANNGELFGKTKELLGSLKSREISFGIISRNCTKAIKMVFPDILSYCPVVVCRDDVENVKPHPQHLNMALNKLGSSSQNTLMIGDHPLDIKAGRNAGTWTCGVLTGRCQRHDFIEAGADLILPQAADVLDIIK